MRTCPGAGATAPPRSERVMKPAAPRPMPGTYPFGASPKFVGAA